MKNWDHVPENIDINISNFRRIPNVILGKIC